MFSSVSFITFIFKKNGERKGLQVGVDWETTYTWGAHFYVVSIQINHHLTLSVRLV